MENKSCLVCRYFDGCRMDYREPVLHGDCRRNPPIPILREGYPNDRMWPPVSLNDWCGQWEPLRRASES